VENHCKVEGTGGYKMAQLTKEDIKGGVSAGNSWQKRGNHTEGHWYKQMDYDGKPYHVFNTGGTGIGSSAKRMWVIDDTVPLTTANIKGRKRGQYEPWREWAEGQIDKTVISDEYAAEGGTIETAPDIDYTQFARFLDEEGNVKDKLGMVTYLQTLPQFKNKEIPEIEEAISEMPKMGIGEAALAGVRGQTQADIYGLQQGLRGERMASRAEAGASGVYSPVSTGFGGDTSTAYGGLADASTGAANIYGLGTAEEEKFANWLGNYS
jgi:hypothetical protein